MPYLGHIIYGFCILIPILYFTKNDKSFNYKVAFIFLANTMFGPDLVGLFGFFEGHGLIGFAILAIPLALFYSYSSRFSLIKSEETFFPLKLEDDGIREVNWKNAYCITVAGGISHLLMDNLFYPELSMELWPGIYISQMELMTWFGTHVQAITPLNIVENVLLVSIIILSLYTFKKGYKSTSQLFLIYIVLIIGLVIVSQATKEFGVIVFCVVYFLLPLFLLMYAARDVQDNPIKPSSEPKSNKKTQLNIVIIIGILLALFLIFYGYYAIISAKTLAAQFVYYYPTQNQDELVDAITIIGYIYLVMNVIYLFSLIGLFFKSNICRYIVIAISSYLLILGFPFAIALFLCEKDVKALFRKES